MGSTDLKATGNYGVPLPLFMAHWWLREQMGKVGLEENGSEMLAQPGGFYQQLYKRGEGYVYRVYLDPTDRYHTAICIGAL